MLENLAAYEQALTSALSECIELRKEHEQFQGRAARFEKIVKDLIFTDRKEAAAEPCKIATTSTRKLAWSEIIFDVVNEETQLFSAGELYQLASERAGEILDKKVGYTFLSRMCKRGQIRKVGCKWTGLGVPRPTFWPSR